MAPSYAKKKTVTGRQSRTPSVTVSRTSSAANTARPLANGATGGGTPPTRSSSTMSSHTTSSSLFRSVSSASNGVKAGNFASPAGNTPLPSHHEDGVAVIDSMRSRRSQTKVTLTQSEVAQLITHFDRLDGSKERLKDRNHHVAFFVRLNQYAATLECNYEDYQEKFGTEPSIGTDHISKTIFDLMGQFVLMQSFVRRCVALGHEGYQEIENNREGLGPPPLELQEFESLYETTATKLAKLTATARRKASHRRIVDEAIDKLKHHTIIDEVRKKSPSFFRAISADEKKLATDGSEVKNVTDGQLDDESQDGELNERVVVTLEAMKKLSQQVSSLQREVTMLKRDAEEAERGYEATKHEAERLTEMVKGHSLAHGVTFTPYDNVYDCVERVLQQAVKQLAAAEERNGSANDQVAALKEKIIQLQRENAGTIANMRKIEVILARKRKCRRRVVCSATEDAIVAHLERRMSDDWPAIFASLLRERDLSDEDTEKLVKETAMNQRVSPVRRAHAALSLYRQVCGRRMDTWTLERVLREHMRYDLAEFVSDKVDEEHRKDSDRPHTPHLSPYRPGGKKEAYLPY